MATSYPRQLLARIVNPGEVDEYLLVGPNALDVNDTTVGDNDVVHPQVARYVLAGVGTVHQTSPVYVEEARA